MCRKACGFESRLPHPTASTRPIPLDRLPRFRTPCRRFPCSWARPISGPAPLASGRGRMYNRPIYRHKPHLGAAPIHFAPVPGTRCRFSTRRGSAACAWGMIAPACATPYATTDLFLYLRPVISQTFTSTAHAGIAERSPTVAQRPTIDPMAAVASLSARGYLHEEKKVLCPYCELPIVAERVESHIQRMHPHVNSAEPMVSGLRAVCGDCGCVLRQDRLRTHSTRCPKRKQASVAKPPSPTMAQPPIPQPHVALPPEVLNSLTQPTKPNRTGPQNIGAPSNLAPTHTNSPRGSGNDPGLTVRVDSNGVVEAVSRPENVVARTRQRTQAALAADPLTESAAAQPQVRGASLNRPAQQVSTETAPKQQTQPVSCPRCAASLLRVHLAAHLQDCAGRGRGKAAVPPNPPSDSSRQQERRQKPGRANKNTQRSGRFSSGRTRDWIMTVNLDQLESEERRDASYGWGPRYREHGRFGSHPAHDDFDDESRP
jgi:hypothetical protein